MLLICKLGNHLSHRMFYTEIRIMEKWSVIELREDCMKSFTYTLVILHGFFLLVKGLQHVALLVTSSFKLTVKLKRSVPRLPSIFTVSPYCLKNQNNKNHTIFHTNNGGSLKCMCNAATELQDLSSPQGFLSPSQMAKMEWSRQPHNWKPGT